MLLLTAGAASYNEPSVRVPVLLYHSIDEEAGENAGLYVKTSEFERQMRYLYEHSYTPVRFAQTEAYKGIEKPVIITFDDGYENNYTNAYPILEKYGFTATVFLVSSTVGTPGHLTAAEISQMKPLVEFGSHTVNHCRLAELGPLAVMRELVSSRSALEAVVGAPVRVLAYPYGSFSDGVAFAASLLYDFAVTTERGFYTPGCDRARISRIYISRDDTAGSFASKLAGGES